MINELETMSYVEDVFVFNLHSTTFSKHFNRNSLCNRNLLHKIFYKNTVIFYKNVLCKPYFVNKPVTCATSTFKDND